MDAFLGVITWLLAVHLVARRGYRTGLFYWRVLFLALVPFLFPFVLVWVFWRDKRPHQGELKKFNQAITRAAFDRTTTEPTKEWQSDK